MSEDEQGYMCEECGEERATVHLTEFVDGKPVQHHYCKDCYNNREGAALMGPAAMFAHILAAVAPELKELSMKQCPECGTSYLEFRQEGLLGCPRDYEVFEEGLTDLLQQIHPGTRHCGKVPPQAGERARIRSDICSLRRRQESAVAEEQYELAARLRDKIEELEARQNELGELER